MQRNQGLTELYFSSADKLVRGSAGAVFSLTLSWTGATAGDKWVLRDGSTAAAPVLVTIVVPAAAGTFARDWINGKAFANGLYIDQQGTGVFEGEMTYK